MVCGDAAGGAGPDAGRDCCGAVRAGRFRGAARASGPDCYDGHRDPASRADVAVSGAYAGFGNDAVAVALFHPPVTVQRRRRR